VSQTATDDAQVEDLEGAMTTDPEPEQRWIERGPRKRLMLSRSRHGRSSPRSASIRSMPSRLLRISRAHSGTL